MRRTIRTLCTALALLPLAATAQKPGGAVPVPEDLLAVLKLRDKPCGSIASYERRSEFDYWVTCSDGHRYRVYVGDGDRVVVEER